MFADHREDIVAQQCTRQANYVKQDVIHVDLLPLSSQCCAESPVFMHAINTLFYQQYD